MTIHSKFFCTTGLVSENMKIKIYRNIVLPPVLYGCETWSATQREEHRLRVFDNRVLRKILGLRWRRYQETGKRRWVHISENSKRMCFIALNFINYNYFSNVAVLYAEILFCNK